MKKFLPILLAATVYLTPLYPVYAQTPPRPKTASAPGTLKIERNLQIQENALERQEARIDKAEDRLAMAKERIASREAQLKEKLAKFKDKAKAQRVENVNSSLYTVNQNITTAMQSMLNRLSQVLEKAKKLSEQAAADGYDVTALNEAIGNAQTAWNQANDAVTAQMEKDYTITVTSETAVGDDARQVRATLGQDLKSLREKVLAAKQAIVSAIQEAKNVRKANNGS